LHREPFLMCFLFPPFVRLGKQVVFEEVGRRQTQSSVVHCFENSEGCAVVRDLNPDDPCPIFDEISGGGGIPYSYQKVNRIFLTREGRPSRLRTAQKYR
jgi:hypothetical protein